MFVGTWNMGDAVPPASLDGWIPRDVHDLYAIATQECTDEHWLAALDVHLGMNYVRIAERRMGGIFLVVFTHRRYASASQHALRRCLYVKTAHSTHVRHPQRIESQQRGYGTHI